MTCYHPSQTLITRPSRDCTSSRPTSSPSCSARRRTCSSSSASSSHGCTSASSSCRRTVSAEETAARRLRSSTGSPLLFGTLSWPKWKSNQLTVDRTSPRRPTSYTRWQYGLSSYSNGTSPARAEGATLCCLDPEEREPRPRGDGESSVLHPTIYSDPSPAIFLHHHCPCCP